MVGDMPLAVKSTLCLVFAVFILAGMLYVARPQLIQRAALKRLALSGKRGSAFIRGSLFPWFIRVVGVLLMLTGLRGLYAIGVWHG